MAEVVGLLGNGDVSIPALEVQPASREAHEPGRGAQKRGFSHPIGPADHQRLT